MSLVVTRDRHFTLLPGETLLEGLERTGHDIEYQCRSGYCGTCRVSLLQGDVVYDEPPLAFVAIGQVLPCCCRPTGTVFLDCHVTQQARQGELFREDLFDSPSGAGYTDKD